MVDTSFITGDERLDAVEQLRYLASRYWTTGVILLILLITWEAVAHLDAQGNNYFPTLEHVVRQTVDSSDLLISSLQATATAAIFAFILAVVLGVFLGLIFSEIGLVRGFGMPVLIFGYALPAAILAPLFVIWFGVGLSGVTAFGAWVAIFPVFINTMTGMNQTDQKYYHAAEVYGATRWQFIRRIKFWKALPHISAGAKVAVQMSIVGVIVGEFIASGTGLGFLIVLAAQRAQLGFTYGTIMILILFSVVFYISVTGLIDRITPHVE